jgi:biopolymer transport protein ExbD
MPDFKTIADFRKDNGKAIRSVCRELIVLCRDLKLFSEAIVAIDGSKFKAVNNRDKHFTDRKLKARMQQMDESIARYMTLYDMQRTNSSFRFLMRTTFIATCLLVFTHFATGQSASPDANADVLTIRISEDGVCHFLDASTPCDQLGQYLLTKHLAQNGHVHIAVDRTSKYELVAATLESLDRAGFNKVGFVNNDAPASQ